MDRLRLWFFVAVTVCLVGGYCIKKWIVPLFTKYGRELRRGERSLSKMFAKQNNVGGRIHNALKRFVENKLSEQGLVVNAIKGSYRPYPRWYSIVVFRATEGPSDFYFDGKRYSGDQILRVNVYACPSPYAVEATYFYDPESFGFPDHPRADDDQAVAKIIKDLCAHIEKVYAYTSRQDGYVSR